MGVAVSSLGIRQRVQLASVEGWDLAQVPRH